MGAFGVRGMGGRLRGVLTSEAVTRHGRDSSLNHGHAGHHGCEKTVDTHIVDDGKCWLLGRTGKRLQGQMMHRGERRGWKERPSLFGRLLSAVSKKDFSSMIPSRLYTPEDTTMRSILDMNDLIC